PRCLVLSRGAAMRRRSRASGDPTKAQRRKTAVRKSRIAPKAVRPRSSSAAREETKVARLTDELNEARRQQTATADVLKESAAAADRHRRRVEGNQPVDIRFADCTRYPDRAV